VFTLVRGTDLINERKQVPNMSEKKVVNVLLSQLEEALEERQNNDRRKQLEAIKPKNVKEERRKNDRRNEKKD
jgi:hypothetical protein